MLESVDLVCWLEAASLFLCLCSLGLADLDVHTNRCLPSLIESKLWWTRWDLQAKCLCFCDDITSSCLFSWLVEGERWLRSPSAPQTALFYSASGGSKKWVEKDLRTSCAFISYYTLESLITCIFVVLQTFMWLNCFVSWISGSCVCLCWRLEVYYLPEGENIMSFHCN